MLWWSVNPRVWMSLPIGGAAAFTFIVYKTKNKEGRVVSPFPRKCGLWSQRFLVEMVLSGVRIILFRPPGFVENKSVAVAMRKSFLKRKSTKTECEKSAIES